MHLQTLLASDILLPTKNSMTNKQSVYHRESCYSNLIKLTSQMGKEESKGL